eukprot:CAMPEP_0168739296 /NCGR_PEP_ID=MMETSP0724-20121128/11382_1 /TAXON_ID=265536 /ORGANISM="Amphiprora sp., Strain CCMP467" /LENGTH=612 /DNA_ID=CAMNT_0008786679 /DNA_START=63 /DNA_END=1901 /DNA_ORIENTATION=-
MEDEDFDELSMGPKDTDLKSVLQSGDTGSNPNPTLLRKSSSSSAGPPRSMFNTTRPISPPARGTGRFNDDEQPPAIATSPSQSVESRRIRQEALKMLEVSDDQLDEGAYSVYRTKTGGFTAEARKEGGEPGKRLPAALSGMNFAASRKNVARPFRDDPYADTEAPAPTSQESYEYGEDDRAVVDMTQLENRASSSRAGDNKASSWSSRYSIDNTMLALSGGSVSSSKLLDRMDKDSRRSAGNLFSSSPSETRAPKIFGSGYSFRKNNVFGKQNVTAKQETNEQDIRSIYKDSTIEPVAPASPARSWQEQFQTRRRQRRNIFIAAGAVVIVFLILVVSVTHHDRNSTPNGAVIDDAGLDANSLTFYVTSDVPLHSVRDTAFHNDLSRMSNTAKFLVHLGDMQLAQNTQCKPQRYSEVAALLRRSPLPVFVVPGEEDWANCPDQNEGWENWSNNFWQFDKQYPTDFDVYRMQDQGENFAFLLDGVLFVGVHETNGRIDHPLELENRNNRNVEWIKRMYNRHGKKARALVLMANGRPAIRENDPFYIGVGDFLFNNKIPTAYIHANDENGKELTYHPYEIEGMDHVIAIQTSKGEDHPPLRINVGFDENDPFIVG